MPRGGKREGAGRKKGSRSAATKDQIANISELAKMHADTAINALAQIVRESESDAARVSAANAILDRGYGKCPQSHDLTSSDGSMTPPSRIEIVPAIDDSAD